ncbi:hypothetical protein KEM52_000406 [Ascosphaera acerosa]|nr:hypothetical protein KEM52_000406 [Ascosphaera acerosa]
MADVASLEAEVKEFKLQLETVQSSLQGDPTNQELLSLQSELEEFISLTEQSIAELRPSIQKQQSSRQADQKEGRAYPHTAEQQSSRAAAAVAAGSADVLPSFNVNDTVLARWASGDGSFYPAKITSITGSKANPKYIVTFKKYNNVETLSAKDVKPIAPAQTSAATAASTAAATITSPASPSEGASSQKRKADAVPSGIIPNTLFHRNNTSLE